MCIRGQLADEEIFCFSFKFFLFFFFFNILLQFLGDRCSWIAGSGSYCSVSSCSRQEKATQRPTVLW